MLLTLAATGTGALAGFTAGLAVLGLRTLVAVVGAVVTGGSASGGAAAGGAAAGGAAAGGAAAGRAALGGAALAPASLLLRPAPLLLGASAVAVAVAADGVWRRRGWPRPLAVRRQVPQAWSRLFAPATTAVLYGARLGVGPLTLLPTWLWWAALAVGALAGPWAGAATGATFGLARSAASITAGEWATRRAAATDVVGAIGPDGGGATGSGWAGATRPDGAGAAPPSGTSGAGEGTAVRMARLQGAEPAAHRAVSTVALIAAALAALSALQLP